MSRFYITTPIYYVNDKPHIGHAYTSLACDVVARWRRLCGDDVLFATGTDEYGQKIEQAATKNGTTPQQFTDKLSVYFKDLCQVMNYSPDIFIRTTETRHTHAVQALWKRLAEQGAIYRGHYRGWYALRDEAYVEESELRVEDGRHFAPSGAECTWTEQPSYFFRLSEFQKPLLEHYRNNPDFIRPQSRANEVLRFVESGLKDLSISRTNFSWGVQVPDDPEHVIYVWLDALTNYMTICDYPDESGKRAAFWPANLHVVGKDILRFHTVYWPAMLMAAGLPLPERVYAHGWWTNEGVKISKSLGNIIDPLELIGMYGVDAVRYFLLREIPFGQDGDFSKENLIRRINVDLGNDFGNLCQRTLKFIAKQYQGRIPEPGNLRPIDKEILEKAKSLIDKLDDQIMALSFHRALESIFALISEANRYIDFCAPWSGIKNDEVHARTCLYVTCELIRHITYCLYPFMPKTAETVLGQLGYGADTRLREDLTNKLPPAQSLGTVAVLFPRILTP